MKATLGRHCCMRNKQPSVCCPPEMYTIHKCCSHNVTVSELTAAQEPQLFEHYPWVVQDEMFSSKAEDPANHFYWLSYWKYVISNFNIKEIHKFKLKCLTTPSSSHKCLGAAHYYMSVDNFNNTTNHKSWGNSDSVNCKRRLVKKMTYINLSQNHNNIFLHICHTGISQISVVWN